MTAHFDLDCIKYAAASMGENRSVLITHKTSGRAIELPTRTDWYGHHLKKSGGRLAEINKNRTSPFLVEDFTYEDIQRPEPIANILHTAKIMVEKAVSASGADSVKYYIGSGDSFRVELSTLLKYKGQRTSMMRPVCLDEVTDYLTRRFKAEVVTNLEVDDLVVINSYRRPNDFIVGLDKDFYGSGSNFFNVDRAAEGIVATDGLGFLGLNTKKKVVGAGRLFKLWQVCSDDGSDNYAANCFSEIKWGAKSAYSALKDCKTDQEAFQVAFDVFKTLYPEPKVVKGWRGNDIEIDALYVFQECFNMAHLHRWNNDFVDVRSTMDKLGVKYE